jgi:hypothetical protein
MADRSVPPERTKGMKEDSMQKILMVLLILALLAAAGVLFISQRYEAIGTKAEDLIVFDRLKCSFIEKNIKGEWEAKPLKKGEIFMEVGPDMKGQGPGKQDTGSKSSTQPQPKPDLKI